MDWWGICPTGPPSSAPPLKKKMAKCPKARALGPVYTNREIRAKITVKEKHVAVTGWFKICVFKYWNVHSCIHDYIIYYNTTWIHHWTFEYFNTHILNYPVTATCCPLNSGFARLRTRYLDAQSNFAIRVLSKWV